MTTKSKGSKLSRIYINPHLYQLLKSFIQLFFTILLVWKKKKKINNSQVVTTLLIFSSLMYMLLFNMILHNSYDSYFLSILFLSFSFICIFKYILESFLCSTDRLSGCYVCKGSIKLPF